jgi:hypothetical protein
MGDEATVDDTGRVREVKLKELVAQACGSWRIEGTNRVRDFAAIYQTAVESIEAENEGRSADAGVHCVWCGASRI